MANRVRRELPPGSKSVKYPANKASPAFSPAAALGRDAAPNQGNAVNAHERRALITRRTSATDATNSLPASRASHLTTLFRFAFFENSTHCPRTYQPDLWTTMNRRTRVNHVHEKAKRRV
jgi:hypothetical protein